MLTDIEIAQINEKKKITEIADGLGIPEHYVELYGNYKAKIDYRLLNRQVMRRRRRRRSTARSSSMRRQRTIRRRRTSAARYSFSNVMSAATAKSISRISNGPTSKVTETSEAAK